jgi:hypothetical protein
MCARSFQATDGPRGRVVRRWPRGG